MNNANILMNWNGRLEKRDMRHEKREMRNEKRGKRKEERKRTEGRAKHVKGNYFPRVHLSILARTHVTGRSA